MSIEKFTDKELLAELCKRGVLQEYSHTESVPKSILARKLARGESNDDLHAWAMAALIRYMDTEGVVAKNLYGEMEWENSKEYTLTVYAVPHAVRYRGNMYKQASEHQENSQ